MSDKFRLYTLELYMIGIQGVSDKFPDVLYM